VSHENFGVENDSTTKKLAIGSKSVLSELMKNIRKMKQRKQCKVGDLPNLIII
jgi:hypothetical protein